MMLEHEWWMCQALEKTFKILYEILLKSCYLSWQHLPQTTSIISVLRSSSCVEIELLENEQKLLETKIVGTCRPSLDDYSPTWKMTFLRPRFNAMMMSRQSFEGKDFAFCTLQIPDHSIEVPYSMCKWNVCLHSSIQIVALSDTKTFFIFFCKQEKNITTCMWLARSHGGRCVYGQGLIRHTRAFSHAALQEQT